MYRALYRKYRPKTFDDVVGQEHITETLKKQVETGRLSHAYLFIGTRGTGKTTCAKILAKAVNCEHPVNGNPCNQCAACRGIDDGSILDVVELDAGLSLGGATYHVVHPGGRSYDHPPVNANEAEARRRARFFAIGHTGGASPEPRPLDNPEHPLTLDLRRAQSL